MTDESVRPDGLQLTVAANGDVIMSFDHSAIPRIRLSNVGAQQVGSNLHSAANREGINDRDE